MCWLFSAGLANEGHFTIEKRQYYKNRVKQMFYHAYDGYLKYSYPYDELRPVTCDGMDTWGGYSLSLVDALDTLAVLNNFTEFQRVYDLMKNIDIERDINVSVFETNIRVIGGLLSAHLLAKRMNVKVNSTWPCTGPLLDLAASLARKLLPAFDTMTGMPYGTVNLFWGVPPDETNETCTAGVGTFLIEFSTLSRLTNDPIFERTALKSLQNVWQRRSSIDLVGNHINVQTGEWTALDCTIGSGVDSYFEYLVKGAILLQEPSLMQMMNEFAAAIEKYMSDSDGWYVYAHSDQGRKTLPMFQALDAFYPGLLVLMGDINRAIKTLYSYHTLWRKYGAMPEYYNLVTQEPVQNREGYPLRPEHIESLMYVYKATNDDQLLFMAADIFEAIESCCKTSCGYTSLKNVKDHQLDNRMESFFLAETIKYLYLIFDEDNFLHNNGLYSIKHQTPTGSCFLETSYIFNTEAHPIDVGSLECCKSKHEEEENLEYYLLLSAMKTLKHDKIFFTTVLNMVVGALWQLLKRHRKKLFFISLLTGGIIRGYAAFRFMNTKLQSMLNEQEKMVLDWKKQLYYTHNRDLSLKTGADIFSQVCINLNQTFECETLLQQLSITSDSTTKRELWEQLRIECFSRLITFSYSSSFILSLTELVVSALSGRLYSQSQQQQQTPLSATTAKSSYAESSQNHSIISHDIQLACLDVIRYATVDGLNFLIEDVRKATKLIFSRIPLQQMLDIQDVIWYCNEIRHHLEKKSTVMHSRQQQQPSIHPFMKYVRSSSLPGGQPTQLSQPSEMLPYSLTNTNSFFTTRNHRPRPSLFNIQQQFELECIEMIESETFQQVLTHVINQSFSSIYDEFASEIAKIKPLSVNSDQNITDQLLNPQLPLAKLIPVCDKIYKKFSNNQEQLIIHFQNLSCRKELHDYSQYAYDLFSNETDQSLSRTAYSLLPTLPSTTAGHNNHPGSNFDLTSLIQSLTQ
ncbi:unnamed protein product [Didymodactylos carnosus]|uniref:alpha-1,2-Mannosidase n=1 Tax=Didymodactylos carnosus TaxID=1234261 RepID=A0A813P096_9BILA|nr:unnamed protein product [Didymodactylos carnosus]CAF0746323.1 unnamed protein product [Didymodactylos carnosus]CAF3515963.1 unnamed protein product [Didymodactylos carnosus]CAF3525144.1 unnamed protein product [Didymodactylos carnosus]